MSNKQKRYILSEEDIPKFWYNIQADMVNKPMAPLNPKTKEPLKPEDLYPIFAKELCHQELDQENAWIEIPETVREMYKYWRWVLRHIFTSKTKVQALSVRIN